MAETKLNAWGKPRRVLDYGYRFSAIPFIEDDGTSPSERYSPSYDGEVAFRRVADGETNTAWAPRIAGAWPLSMFDLVRFRYPDRMWTARPTKAMSRIVFEDGYERHIEQQDWVQEPIRAEWLKDYRENRPFLVWGRASVIMMRIYEWSQKPFLGRPAMPQEKHAYWIKYGVWYWGEMDTYDWMEAIGCFGFEDYYSPQAHALIASLRRTREPEEIGRLVRAYKADVAARLQSRELKLMC